MGYLSFKYRAWRIGVFILGYIMLMTTSHAQLVEQFKIKHAHVAPQLTDYMGAWYGTVQQHKIHLVIAKISQQHIAGQWIVDGKRIPFNVPLKISKIPHDYQFKFTLSEHQYVTLNGQYTGFLDLNELKTIKATAFIEGKNTNFSLSRPQK